MTAASMLSAWVMLPGLAPLRARAEVILDKGWAPYAQALVTVPYSAAVDGVLDQDAIRAASLRVRVLMRRQWYDAPLLSDLGDAWDGLTLADLGTELAGLTLAEIGGALCTAWDETDPWRAPDELYADLTVVGRTIDHAAASIAIRADSDETIPQRMRVGGARALESSAARIAALMTACGLTPPSLAGLPAATVPPITLADSWRAAPWDALMAAAAASARRLWCDLDRVWHLSDPEGAPVGEIEVTRVTTAQDDEDAGGEFADVIVWIATATVHPTDPETSLPLPTYQAVDVRTHPSPVPAGAHTFMTVERDYGDLDILAIPEEWLPTSAELAARLARAQSYDRMLTTTQPADPSVRPGVAVTTGAPSLPALVGTLASVTLTIPEDTMTLTIHAVEEA